MEIEKEDTHSSNHLIFDNSLKETRVIHKTSLYAQRRDNQLILSNSALVNRLHTKTQQEIEDERKQQIESLNDVKLSSSFSSNPHVRSVCKTFNKKIFSDNDLADAVLDCLDD